MSKKISTIIKNIRLEFSSVPIDVSTISKNPFEEFGKWMSMAVKHKIPEPNAMNLATVSVNKRPSSRIVLLRDFDKKGFVFFTNYKSKKGDELAKNAFGALNFFWAPLNKQIRIEGKIVRASKKVSDDYFNSRPLESQIGAWASNQSETIDSRDILDKRITLFSKKFGKKIPRPSHWGGYVLKPDYFEFWHGQTSRLHDRIVFKLKKNKWEIYRIAP